MGRIAFRVSLALLVFGLSFSLGWAQDQTTQEQQGQASQNPKDTGAASPAKPIPPLSAGKTNNETPAAGQNQVTSSQQARKPLSGAEEYTLDTLGQSHNYFYPLFQFAESGDTNSTQEFGSSTLESVSTISGAFTLNHVWSRYNFAANYSGSGFIFNQDPSLSSSAHSLSLSQTITGVHSSLQVTDVASYLPQAAFGFARFGGFGDLGTGGLSGISNANLNGVYIPSQSILTGESSRISNSVVGEYDYSFSPLSSVTFVGSYGLLRFPTTELIDSNSASFGAGYNREINRKDTVAFTYTGTVFRYGETNSNFDFTNHVVTLMYGHRISNLLSVNFGAGPQINVFNNGANDTLVSVYATASLDYRLPRTGLSLSYLHYTTAGSGVFLGARTDSLGINVSRQLTRMWTGNLGLGYSYNQNLQNTVESPTFHTWYGSANLQRPLGNYMSVFLSYNIQQQYSNIPFCAGNNCGSFYTENYFSLGFNWHPRAAELGGIR